MDLIRVVIDCRIFHGTSDMLIQLLVYRHQTTHNSIVSRYFPRHVNIYIHRQCIELTFLYTFITKETLNI